MDWSNPGWCYPGSLNFSEHLHDVQLQGTAGQKHVNTEGVSPGRLGCCACYQKGAGSSPVSSSARKFENSASA